MLKSVLSWRPRSSSSKDAIDCEAEDLILEFGAGAREEARRRRRDSNDLSAARHWDAVGSEIGRRILAGRSGAPDRNALDFIWTPVADRRAESRRLAEIIRAGCGEPAIAHGGRAQVRIARAKSASARSARGRCDVVAELQAAIRSLPAGGPFDAGELAN